MDTIGDVRRGNEINAGSGEMVTLGVYYKRFKNPIE